MKRKVMLISAILVLLLGGFTVYAVTSRTNNITHEKRISKDKKAAPPKKLSKAEAKKINDKFYSHKLINDGGLMDFVGYPSTFSGLVKSGDLTVDGEIIDLKSYVSDNRPYTVAKLRINDVLDGDSKKFNGKTIRVMFLGGNITRKEDAAFSHLKVESGTDPNEIITIENGNNRLPMAGDMVALILSKETSGTNNIPGKFWSISFACKGAFFQDSDGKYRRVPEPQGIGGGGGFEDLTSQKDDEKMNDAMNSLINKTKNKDSKKN
ncbi:MAG TPA: hypothetical protein H9820_03615 [Candidatus Companilactobacillus pullicola]|uniref:Uncharacterized protein n=1 Tax=Candidatus Companilactobacillus pullicola TaxID=2838523 RepID=A0A9D1ZM09_9LACO|nr:hypothetical protein [Candidatus Companilactobacillus pullicola]